MFREGGNLLGHIMTKLSSEQGNPDAAAYDLTKITKLLKLYIFTLNMQNYASSSTQDYMHTILNLAVNMHGSESQANTTTINILHDENNRFKKGNK